MLSLTHSPVYTLSHCLTLTSPLVKYIMKAQISTKCWAIWKHIVYLSFL